MTHRDQQQHHHQQQEQLDPAAATAASTAAAPAAGPAALEAAGIAAAKFSAVADAAAALRGGASRQQQQQEQAGSGLLGFGGLGGARHKRQQSADTLQALLLDDRRGQDFESSGETSSHAHAHAFVSFLRNRSSFGGTVDPSRLRKFVVHLATALHAYGSSAARTEYLVERVASRLDLDVSVAAFPTQLILSFKADPADERSRHETVLLTLSQELDVDKLGRVDDLAQHVEHNRHEVIVAYWKLRAIARGAPKFGTLVRLIAYPIMSATAAPLFFAGGFQDMALGGLLGLAGGLIELWANNHSSVALSVIEFLAAVVAACATRVLTTLFPAHFCFYPAVLSALVWFLPGLSLMMGVNELVAKAWVAGSSRVSAAVFSAFQLGFGIVLGVSLLQLWDHMPVEDCASATGVAATLWFRVIMFFLYVAASNVMVNARWDQWRGMVLVSLVGFVVSEATASIGSEASSVIAACAVSLAGTMYSRFTHQFPLAMKVAGVLLLVPGGVGVRGVASLLDKDVAAGVSFVFNMLMVALSITIGLLLGKIFLPEARFGYGGRKRLTRRQVEQELGQETVPEGMIHAMEEGMAF